jgi:hypothetical protein
MKLQFGSIIVNGAGKINGHQIRNFRGMPLLTRKSIPNKSNFFLNNPAKKVATLAFKYWATLLLSTRQDWEVIASSVPFSDRWGNTKYLSGRDLVSYLYINCANAGLSFPDDKTFTSTIPSFSANDVTIDIKDEIVTVSYFENLGGEIQLIYIRKNPTSIRQLKAKELVLIGAFDISTLSASDLYQAITSTGYEFEQGFSYSFGIKNISSSGMASSMQVFQVLVSGFNNPLQ